MPYNLTDLLSTPTAALPPFCPNCGRYESPQVGLACSGTNICTICATAGPVARKRMRGDWLAGHGFVLAQRAPSPQSVLKQTYPAAQPGDACLYCGIKVGVRAHGYCPACEHRRLAKLTYTASETDSCGMCRAHAKEGFAGKCSACLCDGPAPKQYPVTRAVDPVGQRVHYSKGNVTVSLPRESDDWIWRRCPEDIHGEQNCWEWMFKQAQAFNAPPTGPAKPPMPTPPNFTRNAGPTVNEAWDTILREFEKDRAPEAFEIKPHGSSKAVRYVRASGDLPGKQAVDHMLMQRQLACTLFRRDHAALIAQASEGRSENVARVEAAMWAQAGDDTRLRYLEEAVRLTAEPRMNPVRVQQDPPAWGHDERGARAFTDTYALYAKHDGRWYVYRRDNDDLRASGQRANITEAKAACMAALP